MDQIVRHLNRLKQQVKPETKKSKHNPSSLSTRLQLKSENLGEQEEEGGRSKRMRGVRSRVIKSKGLNLLKVLQSEITHELSSPCFQNNPTVSPGDFTLEWDAPYSQDVLLRRKFDTGEEVAVSAVLGLYYHVMGTTFPWSVNMKVCVKKPGLSSLLQFDCEVVNESYDGVGFNIKSARYLPSTSSIGRRYYTGPPFRDLDPKLQAAFKEYLEARGIRPTLLDFLRQHLHKKEETQYVNWLQKLQEVVS